MLHSIDHYAECWKRAGHRVIEHVGIEGVPSADVVVVHINLTVIPREYREVIERFPCALNGRILDISRQRFSKLLLSRGDSYDGPVIVKTNANYGGKPEHDRSSRLYALATLASGVMQKSLSSTARGTGALRTPLLSELRARCRSFTRGRVGRLHWDSVTKLDPLAYPVYDDMRGVPEGVWENENLIVERFIGDREAGLFSTCYYSFFGEKGVSGRLQSTDPIVKFGNRVSDEEIPVPDEVLRWREDLKIDFGRFDYLQSEGKCFLIDVNKTEGDGDSNFRYPEEMAFLASGLNAFLS